MPEGRAYPFTADDRRHVLPVGLFGVPAILASDCGRITEILAEVFASRHFAAPAEGAAVQFHCSISPEPPWTVAFATPGTIYVARPSAEGQRFDVFHWTPEQAHPAGSFSYDESHVEPSRDTTLELFASYWQRRVLDYLLRRRPEVRLVHAGAIQCGERGVMILAPTKGGKSTLTLASVLAGMRFLSDDFSPVDLQRRLLLPFPRALRLRKNSLALMTEFEPLCKGVTIDVRGETRYYLHPEDVRPDALGETVPLTDIIVLEGFGERSEFAEISPAEVARICMEADCFEQGPGALELLWEWAAVTAETRCLSLIAGPPREAAEALREMLDRGP